jgi:hypothetical protein
VHYFLGLDIVIILYDLIVETQEGIADGAGSLAQPGCEVLDVVLFLVIMVKSDDT